MGGIALPALHLNPPPQQADPIGQYAQLLQLRNMQQNAPLQRQMMQQQIDAGQMANQEKAIQLKDQQTMQQVVQQWAQPKQSATQQPGTAPASSQPNYDDLLDMARKSGVSFGTYQGLQKTVMDMKEKAATIAKDAAQTGNDNAGALLKKNGMLIDGINGILQLPDDQLAPALTAAVQREAQSGLLAPDEARHALQLAQSGDPSEIRKSLTLQTASLGGFSKLVEDSLKKIDLAEKQKTANFYQQNPGAAPGVSAEVTQQSDWLSKHPGMGPSDYAIAMKKIVPAFSFNLQQGAAQGAAGAPAYQAPGGGTDWGKVAAKYGMNQAAFDQTAEKYFSTGQLPQIGRNANAIAMQRDLMNRTAELHPNASLAENTAEFKANTNSLKTLQANFDQVSAFEGTANKNIEMLKGLAAKIPDLGARFANVPVRMLSGSMIGSENMAAFKTALAPVQAESAKILNSANLSGQLSDSSRHELQDIVDGNLTFKSLVASLNVLQQDFKNRHDSISQQIGDIQQRIKNTGGGANSPTPNAADPFAQFGGKAHP